MKAPLTGFPLAFDFNHIVCLFKLVKGSQNLKGYWKLTEIPQTPAPVPEDS
jgi:hypothetical protein